MFLPSWRSCLSAHLFVSEPMDRRGRRYGLAPAVAGTSVTLGLGRCEQRLACRHHGDSGGDALLQMRHWLGAGSSVPALMLVLTMLLRYRRSPSRASWSGGAAPCGYDNSRSRWLRRAGGPRADDGAPTFLLADRGLVHVDGAPAAAVIGCSAHRPEEDNDIRLASRSVHRYHAVIRRTTDGDVVINDQSGTDGTGVLVNGARVSEARLAKGDVIHVGAIKLRFDAQPV
jgi:hypothetical protein